MVRDPYLQSAVSCTGRCSQPARHVLVAVSMGRLCCQLPSGHAGHRKTWTQSQVCGIEGLKSVYIRSNIFPFFVVVVTVEVVDQTSNSTTQSALRNSALLCD